MTSVDPASSHNSLLAGEASCRTDRATIGRTQRLRAADRSTLVHRGPSACPRDRRWHRHPGHPGVRSRHRHRKRGPADHAVTDRPARRASQASRGRWGRPVPDRRFRFDYLREQVERGTGLDGFGFLASEIPGRMTRMQAVVRTWTGSEPLFLMDTGPAAILGALEDPRVSELEHAMVANLGNFHTIAALLDGRRIAGLFEHHTGELTREKLEGYLDALATGTLSNQAVFDDMGHGALELGAVAGPSAPLPLTGPRRALLDGSRLRPNLA